MPRRKYGNTEKKISKWIKQGRGQGHGNEYMPWITVRDLSSRGRSHRVFGNLCQRTHHFFSDLELAVFLILEWNPDTTDIREQFPLRRDETIVIADKAGITHSGYRGIKQVMSSDFLVNTTQSVKPKFALQAKYAKDLQDPRTVEKLEIERRYWESKKIPWQIITEKNIPQVVFQNIESLYPIEREELDHDELIDKCDFYWYHLKANPHQTILKITQNLDKAYDLDIGQSLFDIKVLLAHRYLQFDIFIPVKNLQASELKLSNIAENSEVLNVSS
jgi:hypothetical protein